MLAVYVVFFFFFFSSRRRHTRFDCDWSSDVCSSDLILAVARGDHQRAGGLAVVDDDVALVGDDRGVALRGVRQRRREDRKSTRLNSSHSQISYAVFCLKKKTTRRHEGATARGTR